MLLPAWLAVAGQSITQCDRLPCWPCWGAALKGPAALCKLVFCCLGRQGQSLHAPPHRRLLLTARKRKPSSQPPTRWVPLYRGWKLSGRDALKERAPPESMLHAWEEVPRRRACAAPMAGKACLRSRPVICLCCMAGRAAPLGPCPDLMAVLASEPEEEAR